MQANASCELCISDSTDSEFSLLTGGSQLGGGTTGVSQLGGGTTGVSQLGGCTFKDGCLGRAVTVGEGWLERAVITHGEGGLVTAVTSGTGCAGLNIASPGCAGLNIASAEEARLTGLNTASAGAAATPGAGPAGINISPGAAGLYPAPPGSEESAGVNTIQPFHQGSRGLQKLFSVKILTILKSGRFLGLLIAHPVFILIKGTVSQTKYGFFLSIELLLYGKQ